MRLRRKRETTETRLPYKAVAKNLVLTDEKELWAVYRLAHTPWEFSSPTDRDSAVWDTRRGWASLAGHRVQVRMTSYPYPHAAWARELDQRSPRRVRDGSHGETWDEYLAASQRAICADGLRVPTVYMSVRITQNFRASDMQYVTGNVTNSSKRITEVRKALARVTNTISGPGFKGAPVRKSREMAWLIHASLALGVPSPTVSTGDGIITDLDRECFTSPVTIDAVPYGPAARVAANRDGRTITRWVTVLTVGRVEDRELNSLPPWAAFAAAMPFPVEGVATVDVVDGDAVRRTARNAKEKALDQRAHYEEHGDEIPYELERVIETGRRMEDEVSAGTPETAVRVIGPVRFAVPGSTEDEVADRVQHLTGQMARHQLMHLVHTRAQAALLSEFLPCSPTRIPGLDQWMPATFASTAGWNTTPRPGTPSGPLLGATTSGPPQAVLFNPHYGPQHDQSGLAVVAGAQGSGKSVLLGVLVEQAARFGVRTVVVDPSGRLTAVADLPHLRGVSHVVDLGASNAGTLNPYQLVPDTGDEEAARGERRALAQDALLMLIPPAMLASGEGGVMTEVVMRAVADAPADADSTPWPVLDLLRGNGDVGRRVSRILADAARQPGGKLLFPDESSRGALRDDDAILTVIATPGFTAPPPGIPRVQWTHDEQIAALVAHLATRYAVSTMYRDETRKVIAIDEAGLVGGSTAFQGFAVRCGRDSRKWNTLVAIASQNPADLLALDPELPNLVGAAWIGRVTGTAAESGLALAGVPTGIGHEQSLARLASGQFLFRCWDSTCWMQVYLNHRPSLAAVLNTTPASVEEDFDAELVHA